MNEYRAFMRAIQAAPEDDLPRLVFADWLDERGDPRGEFIRVQIGLARMLPNDPSRVALKTRENQLLEAHGEKWRFWPNRMYDRQDAPFERGFMATEIKPPQWQILYLSNDQLTSLSGMPELPGLQELDLYNNQLTSLSGMPELPQLQQLDLHNNQLTSLSGMPELPGLRWLYLQGNPLKTEEIQKLARGEYGCKNLQALSIDSKYVPAFQAALAESDGLPNLRLLNGQAVVHHVVPSVPPDAPGGESTQELTELPATASSNDNTHQFTAFPEVKVESVQRSEPPLHKPSNAMLA